ncbi:MAG: stimulus-sensing domain-containing protein, partial [Proteobacteria bacterium]|nr:stimulus-sensing domain-containing protein [Pseudomonadota bacterium]
MAIDWNHVTALGEKAGARLQGPRVALALSRVTLGYRWLRARFVRTSLARFFAQSLAHRIFFSNLLGLVLLLGGIFWVSQHQALLVTARQESLRVQGEIIAAAIAANATVSTNDLTFDRQPEVQSIKAPFRDDGFASLDGLELSIRPDQVGPVIRKLIQPVHNTRARIYDRDGELVVDTHPKTKRVPARGAEGENGEKVRVKTNWTRFLTWFDGTGTPIYYEIGGANGSYYPEVRQALRGDKPASMVLITEEGHQIVSLAVPIQRRNATLGALLLSTRPGEIDSILGRERRIYFSLAIVALLTTLVASMQLTRSIAEPVRRLSAAADHVSKSMSARAELPDYSLRQDEVGRMASAFRRMTAALYRRIEASEKFAADVAHELKNPLTAARSTAESMSYARTPEQREQLAQQIQSELKRLNRLITDVSYASRLDAELARQETEVLDLGETLKGLVGVLGDIHSGNGRSVSLETAAAQGSDPRLLVKGHEGRLGQVATNLIDNAASFSPEGGKVSVRLEQVGAEIQLSVEDQGPGIPEDKLEKIFERFYSDRPQSDGTIGKNSGLGLSISREIV